MQGTLETQYREQDPAQYFAAHGLRLQVANCAFSEMNTLIFADANHFDDSGDIGSVINELYPMATVLDEDVVPEVGRELRHIPEQATVVSWENTRNRALADLVGDRERLLGSKIRALTDARRQFLSGAGIGRFAIAVASELLHIPNRLMRELQARDREIVRNQDAFAKLSRYGNQVIVAARSIDMLMATLETRRSLGPGPELLVTIAGGDHINSEILSSLSANGIRYMVVTQLHPTKLTREDQELIAEIQAEMPLDRAKAKRIWLGQDEE